MSKAADVPDRHQAGRPKNARWQRREKTLAGVALVAIGLLVLAAQTANEPTLGLLVMPGLGGIFLLWGITTRSAGLLIPGGILSGIGLGIWLLQAPFGANLSGDARGAVFLLAFAGGWGLLVLLSALLTDETQWWALVPGAIMALIGGALLAGGIAREALALVGTFWPVALIALGVYFLVRGTLARGDEVGTS